jgi:hypothetical protein
MPDISSVANPDKYPMGSAEATAALTRTVGVIAMSSSRRSTMAWSVTKNKRPTVERYGAVLDKRALRELRFTGTRPRSMQRWVMKINYLSCVALVVLASIRVTVHSSYAGMGENKVDDSKIKVTTVAQVGSLRAAMISQIWGVPWSEVVGRQPNQTADRCTPISGALGDGLDSVSTAMSGPNSGLDRIERVSTTLSEPQITGPDLVHTSTAFIYHPIAPA